MNAPMTVLVVEDDADLCQSIAFGLKLCGYEVLAADSAETAIDSSFECGQQIDIVLTDVVLPMMNGVELVQVLSSRSPELKALFMSGYTDDVLREHGLANAESRFLHKPFSIDELSKKIREQFPDAPSKDTGAMHRERRTQ